MLPEAPGVVGFMSKLNNLPIMLRLQALVLVSVLSFCGLAELMVADRYDIMRDARVQKLRAASKSVVSIAAGLEQRVQAGALTREQAIAQFRDIARSIRFDGKTGYIFVYGMDGLTLVLGPTPEVEGTNRLNFTDPTGKPFVRDLIEAARQGGGTVAFEYPKPGAAEPLPKLGYAAPFLPWKLMVGSGIYIDDLRADAIASLERIGAVIAALLLVSTLVAWAVARGIARPLTRLQRSMASLADGDLAGEIPYTDRRDEVGRMAGALGLFQQRLAEAARLASAEHQALLQQISSEKQQALRGMADTIEAESGRALGEVLQRTATITSAAANMRDAARRTGKSARSAADAAVLALNNVHAVTGAGEQLSASIAEIGVQVTQSNAIVRRAVIAGEQTRASIEALNGQVGRIGKVADMIGEIAARTNLLALNATIEAARAGEAGRGFAVVAGEVKQLASQTARSTEEITRHIAEVRQATGASVQAVQLIEQTIREMDAIAGSIAAAVERQGAATAEIARTVNSTAGGAHEMTFHTVDVSTEAVQTGLDAVTVHENAEGLAAAVSELRRTVVRVVRSSTTEVDRRHAIRHPTDLPCRLAVAGAAPVTARVVNLSSDGGRVEDGPVLPVGATGTLTIDGLGFPLPFSVRAAEDGALGVAFTLEPPQHERLGAFAKQAALPHAA